MDEAELLTSTDQKMDDASTANPASPSSDDSGESDSEIESNHRIETLEAELSANPYIYDAYGQTTGDPTRGASVEEEPLAKRQKSNDMDAEDKSANKISTESETANSNKEESPVKLKICTDECTAFHSNLSAKAQGVSSSSLVNSELDSVEGCPSDAPMGVEIGVAGAVSSSSVGHVAVSSDSVIASMELEKNSVLQSSLDSNEVSRNTSETVCVPSLAHVTDNQDSDSSSRLSGGHGRNDKVANDSKEDDKSHLDKEKRVKRRKKRRSSRSMTVSQRLGAIDKTTADIDLGILDALEVATNIAQEVAREVDSGEASHSSSDQELSDESGESDSQHSHSDDLHTGPPSQRLSVGESHSLEEPHVGELVVMNEKNNILENGMVNSDDIKEKHLGEPAKSEVGREKSPWGFDLNEDICPEETDVVIPVSHSGIPAAGPLQLERSLSAKGLAACSVSNIVPSVDSREKKVICIDLNAAEAGDDQVEDKTPWKQFPFSSSNSRVGESSHEANLHGSSRFNLDLNCTNEDDDIPPRSELKMETRLFLSHNGQQSGSQLSSLSVAQQSGKEVNFDLNDRPQFVVDSRDQGPYYGQQPWSTASYGVQKLDEPVISLLGTKVDVDRKESVSQMASFLSNGKSLETSAGSYMGKTGKSLSLAPCVSFCPAPIYGYNGFTGPPGMSMSSTPMYVPGTSIPYMVDARGTPVMMGSAPYAQPPFPPQQHMFMSLAGGSPSLNGSVQPRFDQSYGFGVEMGNRESLSLRQFLSPGQSGAMGEHSRASVEPSSSLSIGIGGKRKEPETPRWEFPPPWR